MITDYASLQAALAIYAIRTDQGANWPIAVQMGEARLNRLLSAREMVATVEGSVTGARAALPGDFNGAKALRLTGDDTTKLEPVSVDEMDALKAGPDVSGAPRVYAITGANLEVYPEPATAAAYQLTYFQNLPALSDANPSNWLLVKHPDVYLYASLVSFGVMVQDERLSAWQGELSNIVGEIEANDRAAVAGDRLTPFTNTRII
ncbi:MAG TPA: hypothetical protein VGL66_06490 [Caulobacteraceae bacterium]|jgi:hypothetical protein